MSSERSTAVTPSLSNEEFARYSRHLVLPEVGLAGQRRLKGARVLCIGAGGLGSPVALYLAAAGVGTIGLVDFDRVELSNLQRQVIHTTQDVGRPKVASAAEKLQAINPHVALEVHDTRLSSENALEIIGSYDLVVDGTDNFATRYLTNDACVLTGRPFVYASVFRFEGQASVFASPNAPCYRCLYPVPPPPGTVPSCAEGGVLGVLPGLLGVIQANEAIKLILGVGETLAGRLLLVDALAMRFREVRLRSDPACPVCGEHPTLHELIDYEEFCGIRGEEASSAITVPQIEPEELDRRMKEGETLMLLDVREPQEREICALAGSSLIPLNELPGRIDTLDRSEEIVVYCKVGARSARAVKMLQEAGFARARNLAGGIDAWAERIDPLLPRY